MARRVRSLEPVNRGRHFVLRDMVVSSGRLGVNEDRAGLVGNVAWVVDGATQLESGHYLPSASEGTWIAEIVQCELERSCFPSYHGSLVDLAETLADSIKNRLLEELFPIERTPPLASLGVARLGRESIDVALLGDISVVARSYSAVEHCFDERFLSNEATGTALHAADTDRLIEGVLERRRRYIEGSGGPIVLSSNPAVVRHCFIQSFALASDFSLLLASDGFMRLLNVYREVGSAEELIDLAERHGLPELFCRLRSIERSAVQSRSPRMNVKTVDDAAAVLIGVAE
jgi:hypothetical protein